VIEALGQLLDAQAGLAVGCLDVAIEAAVGDDLDRVLDVVEDEQGVDEHEERLGQAQRIVGGHLYARLEVADGVVGEEADGAAGEARQRKTR